MNRAGLRAAVGALVAMTALGALASPASAHASLVSSNPAPGSTVTELSHIDLRFSEAVEPAGSHVWIGDAAGYLELAAPSHLGGDPATLTVSVPALGAGDYEVVWHSLATDGHAEQGSFDLHLAPESASTTAVALADPAADPPPDGSLAIPLGDIAGLAPPPRGAHGHGPGDTTTGLARGALDASLAVLIGGLGFLVVVWPRGLRLFRARQVLWAAAGVAAIASVELTAFQHAGATGTSTFAALTPGQLLDAMDFRFGRVAAARLLLIALSLVLIARVANTRTAPCTPRWRAAMALLAIGLAETLVLLGHGSGLVGVEPVARLVHVLGISAWLGGLVMLVVAVLPRRRADELLAVLPRFSRFATASIGLLVVGGTVLAVELVGRPAALTSTPYGRALVAKLAVVGLLFIAAAASRAHVRQALRQAGAQSGAAIARPLVVWVGIEVGLMAGVLAITAVLVSRVPPA